METSKFMMMLNDNHLYDLKKMQNKYSQQDISEFLKYYKANLLTQISCTDFKNSLICYNMFHKEINSKVIKRLLLQQHNSTYAINAMEEEIISSFKIENIESSKSSVRKILNGKAPIDAEEEKIYSMKKGIEYISNKENKITSNNIEELYRQAVMPSLNTTDQLLEGSQYRHDAVMIVSSKLEHIGMDYHKIPNAMDQLLEFINEDNISNDLVKAAIIHFMIAYIHPYFDGNGRMARLFHLWYLIQRDYSSILFVSLAHYVEKSKKEYYKAFKLIEDNERISKILDITPFILFFINSVYNRIETKQELIINEKFTEILNEGKVTEKEKSLWLFIQMNYGKAGFSTKQLEKDYLDVAYATIFNFVNKFEDYGLLRSEQYSNRRKYFIFEQG